MKRLKILATTMAVTLGLASSAFAAEPGRFTSHYLVPKEDYSNYAESLPAENKLELRNYLDYEERQQCQGYRPPPAGFVDTPDPCAISYYRPQRVVRETFVPRERMAMRPVVSDYEVKFDFDKAEIRPSEQDTIAAVVRDIERINPLEVTIVGHADTSGPADYNVQLSQNRALAVSEELTRRGIPNRVLENRAAGESDLAVPTNDGVQLEENRRVQIQFRK